MATEGFPGTTIEVEVSNNELQVFHSIDRRLYTILVTELWRNPVESLLVMSLWLWLERAGFYNIVRKMLTLPAILISELADEALICLSVINESLSQLSFEATDIPLTQNLIKQEISLQYLQDNKNLARIGVENVRSKICVNVFADITKDAITRHVAAKRFAAENQQMFLQQQLQVPNGVMSAEERTMFVTFSKGYPVAEWEVREFFVNMYGNCIESFYMQDVKPGDEQALFARIVFFRSDIIHMILSGVPKAKFTINGKHVWMRKYVPKRQKILPMQRQHANHSGGA